MLSTLDPPISCGHRLSTEFFRVPICFANIDRRSAKADATNEPRPCLPQCRVSTPQNAPDSRARPFRSSRPASAGP